MKKSTGVVFLVVVVLAAVAYFYDWKPRPYQPNLENTVQVPFTVQEEDIIQISITRAGGKLVFDRKNDGWHFPQPVGERANQGAVNNVAHYISIVPEDTKVPATPEQMETYGLNHPAQVVQFK